MHSVASWLEGQGQGLEQRLRQVGGEITIYLEVNGLAVRCSQDAKTPP